MVHLFLQVGYLLFEAKLRGYEIRREAKLRGYEIRRSK